MKNIKAKLLGLLAVVAVVFSVFAVSVFADTPVKVTNTAELNAALSNGTVDTIELQNDITTDAVLMFNDGDTINLNGKTLTLGAGNNVVAANAKVTVTNGTVCIDNLDVDTDNTKGTQNVFNIHADGARLTLQGVTLNGKDYASENGVFHLGAKAAVVVDNSTFNLADDKSVDMRGGVFMGQNGNITSGQVYVQNNSVLNLYNTNRGFGACQVDIRDSVVNITGDGVNLEHGINNSPNVYVHNSALTISGGSGRGITLGRIDDTKLTITGGSKVSITDMGLATIEVRSDLSRLVLEHDSHLVMDTNISYTNEAWKANILGGIVEGSHIILGRFTDMSLSADAITGVADIVNPGSGIVFDGADGSYVYFEAYIEDVNHHTSAIHSVAVELYSGSKLLATSTLRDDLVAGVEGNLLGVKVEITNESSSWETEMNVPYYAWNEAPTKAILYVNGAAIAVAEQFEAMGENDLPETLVWGKVSGVVDNADVWMANDADDKFENGKFYGGKFYATVADALNNINAASDPKNPVIYVLRDATLPYVARNAYGDSNTESITFAGLDVYNDPANTVTLTLDRQNAYWGGIDMANANGEFLYENINVVDTGKQNYVAEIITKKGLVGKVDATELHNAVANLQAGDTLKLLQNVTLTQGIKITAPAVLADFTFDGNNKILTADFGTPDVATDSVLYFGDASANAWATGVTVKNLSINGQGRFGIALMGSGVSMANIENVSVTGEWYYGLNLYGMMGANVKLSNFSSVFTNAASTNPLNLDSVKIDELYVNDSTGNYKFKVNVADTADYYYPTEIKNLKVAGGSTLNVAPAVWQNGHVAIANITDWDTGAAMVALGTDEILYTTVNAAIKANENGTVTLLSDVTEDVTASVDVTLDLAEKTLNGYFDTYADVTVKNGTITTTTNPLSITSDNATLTVENVVVNAYSVAFELKSGATLTVDADSVINALVAVNFTGAGAEATINGTVNTTGHVVTFGVNLNNTAAINGTVADTGLLIDDFAQGETTVTTLSKDLADRFVREGFEVEKEGKVYYVTANLEGKVAYYLDEDENKIYLEDLIVGTLLANGLNDGTTIYVLDTTAIKSIGDAKANAGTYAYDLLGQEWHPTDNKAYPVNAGVNLVFYNGIITGANQFNINSKSSITLGDGLYCEKTLSVKLGASLTVENGATANCEIDAQGTVTVAGAVEKLSVAHENSNVTIDDGAYVYGSITFKNTGVNATINMNGGEIAELTLAGAQHFNMNGGEIDKLTISGNGSVVFDSYGGHIDEVLVTATAGSVYFDGEIVVERLLNFGKADVQVWGGSFGHDVSELCLDNLCTLYNDETGYYEVVELPAVRHYGNSMTLGTGIALNFWFVADNFVDDNYYAVAIVRHNTGVNYGGCDQDDEYVLIPMSKWVVREGSDLIGFAVDVAAKDMICEIEVLLYRGEQPTYLEDADDLAAITAYSVSTYTAANPDGAEVKDSIEILAMDSIVAALKAGDNKAAAMFADLLHYGAAAQNYFDHAVSHHADHLLEKFPEYNVATSDDVIDAAKKNGEIAYTYSATGVYYGTSLTLEGTIKLNVYFAVDPTADVSNYTAKYSYVNYLGETVSVELDADDIAVNNKTFTDAVTGNEYRTISITVDGLAPADGNTKVSVELVDDANVVVATYTDSILCYALSAKVGDDFAALLDKVAKFSYSAGEYFAD